MDINKKFFRRIFSIDFSIHVYFCRSYRCCYLPCPVKEFFGNRVASALCSDWVLSIVVKSDYVNSLRERTEIEVLCHTACFVKLRNDGWVFCFLHALRKKQFWMPLGTQNIPQIMMLPRTKRFLLFCQWAPRLRSSRYCFMAILLILFTCMLYGVFNNERRIFYINA